MYNPTTFKHKAITAGLAFALGISSVVGIAPRIARATTTTGSITLSQALTHPAAAYQVFDGDVASDGSVSSVTWGAGVNGTALLTALQAETAFASCTSAADVADVLDGLAKDAPAAKTFALLAAQNLNASGKKAFNGTDSKSGAASALDDGYYIVVSDTGATADGAALIFPGLITVGAENVALTPKEATPTLDKKVYNNEGALAEAHDVEVGDTVKYSVDITIPENVAYYETYYMKLTDTLPTGFTYKADSLTVKKGAADVASTAYTATGSGTSIEVEIEDVKQIEGWSGATLTIEYEATVGTDAAKNATGNTNSASIEYSSDPTWDGTGTRPTENTPPDVAKVYTFTLDVVKTNADGTQNLPGMKFTLKNASDQYVQADGTLGANAYEFTTDAQGKAAIAGIDAGTYTLHETTPPTGYEPIADMTVTITPTYDAAGALTQLSVTSSDASVTCAATPSAGGTATIPNDKAPALPVTGLGGVMSTVLVGGGLLGACAVAFNKLKKEDK